MFILIPLFVLLIILTSIYVFSFFKDDDKRHRTFILKVCCAMVFAIIGVIAFILSKERLMKQTLILVGLLLCMAGDVLLGLRRITKFHDGFFIIGTLVFVVAHLVYDIALMIDYNENLLIQQILTITYWLIIFLVTKFTKVEFRSFQIFCYFYMMSSAFMLSIATISLIKAFSMFTLIMFIGIFLFVLSDVLLCYTYFHKRIKESFLVKLISSYTYFLGQGLIGICVLLLV